MRDIETKISPIISSLFPSFYQEEGPNFIAFVKAYYEWLEQNFQLIDLESVLGFNVGDTIAQDNVTGTIYAILDGSALVLVDGLETFKCLNVCSEIIPVTSSSGASTFILRGGTARRLGSLFMSRNLLNIRDIDSTIDLFVVRFKEKYLKNIEFDTQTNKRLLVKNSLDLYRAKGTSRAIDLFFRLIYGIKADVYYPGDDLFRLSDAEWFTPRYIEIFPSSTERAITLVGKQVVGVDSSATAFVERYVKKKVKDNAVHLLYVSNVKGAFGVGERIKYQELFDDSPIVIGSLTAANIVDGSEGFSVGDLVDVSGRLGDKALGRVTAVVRGNGKVSFELLNNGWGFTTNLAGAVNNDSTNTFISDKILTIANAEPGRYITNAVIVDPGTGYNNTDIITISSGYKPARFRPTTNNSGSITSLVILDRGNGYFPDLFEPFVAPPISGGTDLELQYEYGYPDTYFNYLETLTQPIHTVTYNNEQNVEQFVAGDRLTINEDGVGSLIDIDTSANTMRISAFNKHQFFPGETIARVANAAHSVDVVSVALSNTTGLVINTSPIVTLTLGPPDGVLFNVGDTLFQTDSANSVIANGVITRTSGLTLVGGTVEVGDATGVFRSNNSVRILGKTSTAELLSATIRVAVSNTSNTFLDTGTPFVYSAVTGVGGYTSTVSSGAGASYRISSITDSEQVFVNTDRLNNTTILDTRLNAVAYNLPASPLPNLLSVINDPANVAEPDATAWVLMDGPFYNTPGDPNSGFVGGQSWRKMEPAAPVNGKTSYVFGDEGINWTGTAWQYTNVTSGVISTSADNVTYPWLATWTNGYLAAKIAPTYVKTTNFLPSANLSSIIYSGLSFTDITIGSIGLLGQINPGVDYRSDPVTSNFQPNITGYRAHDYIMAVDSTNARYVIGEYVTQNIPTNTTAVVVLDASAYRRGEKVHAANTTTNYVANGVIRSIDLGTQTIVLGTLEGNIPSSSDYTLKSLFSIANSTIVSAVGATFNTQARGIVTGVSEGQLSVKRIQLANNFVLNQPLDGSSTGSNALLRSVSLDLSTPVAGLNSSINAKASTGEGIIDGIQIVDSGYGFSYGSDLTFTASNDERTGIINPILGGVGSSRGFYRNARGFVSDLSKVHDGDYYQEYSYDIISRIPLDRYNDMFKNVMHTAGSRFFGSVFLDSLGNIGVTPASSATSIDGPVPSIEVANNSAYVVEDRQDIDVVDRTAFYVEIREF